MLRSSSKARSEGEAMALAWCAALVVPEDRLSPSSKSKDAGLEGLARGVESGAMGEAVALTLRTTGEALRAANVPRSFERAIVETAAEYVAYRSRDAPKLFYSAVAVAFLLV